MTYHIRAGLFGLGITYLLTSTAYTFGRHVEGIERCQEFGMTELFRREFPSTLARDSRREAELRSTYFSNHDEPLLTVQGDPELTRAAQRGYTAWNLVKRRCSEDNKIRWDAPPAEIPLPCFL